jgi:hypothetical protein
MRYKILPTSAAVLLLGTALAIAQGGPQHQRQGGAMDHSTAGQSERSGAAQEHGQSPGQPTRHSQSQDNRGRAQTTGQGQGREQEHDRTQGQGQGQNKEQERNPNKGQRSQNRDQDHPRTQGQREQHREQNQTKGQGERSQSREQERSGNHQGQRQQPNEQHEGNRTTGQGARGAGSVTLSSEQRTRIRQTVIEGGKAPRVSSVNFSINVGTVVPRRVHLVTVPQVIVDVHPEWRGFMYFVYNDEVIIVDRRTHKIVAVIEV